MNLYELIYKKTRNKNNLVFHLHNDIGDASKNVKLCRLISRTASKIIVVSEYIKNRFMETAPTDKISVLYNCVDSELFNPFQVQSRRVIRNKYHIYYGDFVFLFSGRIAPEKGVRELIEAFSMLNKYQQAKLLIVGTSWFNRDSEDDYMKEVKRLSEPFRKRIIFTGYVAANNMPDMYAAADAVVIPSVWEEPLGVVALEAMAMKKPMVLSESGGLVEVVSNTNALFVKRDDQFTKQLAYNMKLLMENSRLRETMANNAYREFTRQGEFQKHNYLHNYLKIIGLKEDEIKKQDIVSEVLLGRNS
jgi:glycosyltransferase involved in cell wall biosynthesis